MVFNMENLINPKFEKKTFFFRNKFFISFFLFLILLIGLIIHFSKTNSRTYIIAEFNESGPLHKNMPVYFKGYKIGKVANVELDKEYKNTIVKIVLYPKEPRLSKDIIAKVKTHDILRMDYIELKIPEEASDELLQKGDAIEGEGAFDMSSLLSEIADAKIIVPLLESAIEASESITNATTQAGNSFSEITSILKENKNNIKTTTKELASTTKSLNQMSSNLNISLTKTVLSNSTKNIDQSTSNILKTSENIKNISENIDKATKDIDKTIEKIDCAISQTSSTVGNLNVIANGFRKTFSKSFGGLRVIFGKSIKYNNFAKNYCR